MTRSRLALQWCHATPSTNARVEVYFYRVLLALDDLLPELVASYEHTRPTSGGPCTVLPQATWISDDGAVYLLSWMRAILRAQKTIVVCCVSLLTIIVILSIE